MSCSLYKFFLIIQLVIVGNCKTLTTESALPLNQCSVGSPCPNENDKKMYALVLARGGSKGVQRKNLRQINGVSLLGRTLTELNNSALFAEIWVSTEDVEIAAAAQQYSALVHKRPIHLATDTTSSIDAVKEFLHNHMYIEKLALFQCTSIFLKGKYIKEAVDKFRTAECVFSVSQSFKLRWRYYDLKQGLVEPVNFDLKSRPRRQDLSGEFYENGMFYMANSDLILESSAFQNQFCKIVVISKKDELEIDTEEDIVMAEKLIQ